MRLSFIGQTAWKSRHGNGGEAGGLGCSGVCYNLITKGGRTGAWSQILREADLYYDLYYIRNVSGQALGNSLGARVLLGGGKEGRERAPFFI